MAVPKKRTDATSADSIQLGFEYQYLYFIVKLLELIPNQEVGYEALDDIHVVSCSEGKTYFVQLKHTIERDVVGNQANLTRLSDELWKTLSNWSRLITDKIEGRQKIATQKSFLQKAAFELVLNRKIDNNLVIINIGKLQEGVISTSQLVSFFQDLRSKTKDTKLAGYIEHVISLDISVFSLFMEKIAFRNTPDILFDSIREGIRGKMINDEYVNEVLGALYLQLKEDFFSKVQNGKHQVITYSEWIKKYQSVFNTSRTTLLPLRIYEPALPQHLDEQPFVKELIEIGALDQDENGLAEIAELTRLYLHIRLQLESWHNEGRLTNVALHQFHSEAAHCWKRIHQAQHRSTKETPDKDIENALSCFDVVMNEKLTLLSTELGVPLSNGEFVNLANDEVIGWKYSWKGRYYKNADQHTEK